MGTMIVEIIAIVNEVVQGDVLNSNASWLSQRMSELGFEVKYHTAVPDEEGLMFEAFRNASSRAQVVLVTGGLGPTVDDFSLEVAAKFFGKPLELHAESLAKIKKFFERLGRSMTPNQEKQALLPKDATPLCNDRGTAPGIYYCHQQVHFAFFPGVPKEMQAMFEGAFLPLLPASTRKMTRVKKVLRCFGLPEGQMDHQLQSLLKGRVELQQAELGFRVRFPTIDIRLTASHADAKEAQARVAAAAEKVREKLGDHIFSEDEAEELEMLVGRLLREKGKTIATAESCTGGLLAHLITNVPGASEYFKEGVVTYSNEAKVKLLGVPSQTLEEAGAVSHKTALAMARGIRQLASAEIGVAITGIAGPSGGSAEKPVGTVHIAVVDSQEEWEKKFYFPFDRERFKQVAAATALDRVRRVLLRSKPKSYA